MFINWVKEMELDKSFDRWLYIYGFIVSVALLIFAGLTWSMSFLLGLATAVFNYRLMTNSVRNSLELPEGSRMGYVFRGQMIRFAIYFVILLGAAFTEQIEIILTFVGMLSVKIVMFVYILLKKEGDE